jgi:hypothetical protein
MVNKKHRNGVHVLVCKFKSHPFDRWLIRSLPSDPIVRSLPDIFFPFVHPCNSVTITYPNGDTYEGEINDLKKKHGQGKYTHPAPVAEEEESDEAVATLKDHVYDGAWINGEKEGIGKMFYPDGARYYGQWSHNVAHGEGTYKYPNGDVYSGQWSQGTKSGQGSYEYGGNGTQLVGTWVEGSIATGQWIYKNGNSWNGQFKNGKPIGRGAYITKTGNVQNGEWVEILQDEADEEGVTDLLWRGDCPQKSDIAAAALNRATYKKELPAVDWSQKVEVKEEEE